MKRKTYENDGKGKMKLGKLKKKDLWETNEMLVGSEMERMWIKID